MKKISESKLSVDPIVQQIRKECANDLINFGKIVSGKTFTLKTPEFHNEMAGLMMDRTKKLVGIEAPRGYGKSSLCSFMVLHHLIYDKGDKLVVVQSKTGRPEAVRRLKKIKNIIEYSANFQRIFGYFGMQKSDVWRDDGFTVKTPFGTWTVVAKGTGMQVRGMNEDDTRITLYYLDDPDDEDNCKSKEMMIDNYSKFLGGIEGLAKKTGRAIAVGTPITEGCIIDRVMKSDGWDTLHFSACDEENKTVLWPEMETYEEIMRKKKLMESEGFLWKFYAEYQCVLKGKDDQIFRPENFRYYKGEFVRGVEQEHFLKVYGIYDDNKEPIELYDEGLLIPVYTFIGVDPSFSLNPKADFSVIMPVAVTSDWRIFQLPYVRGRYLQSELTNAIEAVYKIYDTKRVTIESGAQQDTIRQSLHIQNISIPGLFAKTQSPKDSKTKRYIDILQSYHSSNKIFLDINNSAELYDEMVMHPSTSMHDDTIDALYWAVFRAYTPVHNSEPVQKSITNRFRRSMMNMWKVV